MVLLDLVLASSLRWWQMLQMQMPHRALGIGWHAMVPMITHINNMITER